MHAFVFYSTSISRFPNKIAIMSGCKIFFLPDDWDYTWDIKSEVYDARLDYDCLQKFRGTVPISFHPVDWGVYRRMNALFGEIFFLRIFVTVFSPPDIKSLALSHNWL